MSSKTKNYNLTKRDETDFYGVEDFNQNAEIIDESLDSLQKQIDNIDLTAQLEPYAKKTEVTTAIEAGQDLLFTNVSVPASAWTDTSNYTYAKYQAIVNLAGVTSAMDAEVFYAPDDADSGIFSGAGMVNDGSITLLAIKQPTSNLTIPKIRVMKGVSV